MFSILFSWTLLRVYDVILSQHFLAWIWYTEVPTHTWSYGMMWLWFWKPTGKLTLRVLQVLRGKNWKRNKLVQDYCLVNDEATSRVPVPLNLTIRAFLLSLLIDLNCPDLFEISFDRLWVQLRRIWVFIHNLLNWTRIFVAKLSAYVNTAITLGYRANQDGWNLWEEMVSACPPTPNLSEAVCLPSGIATAISSSLPESNCHAYHFSDQSLNWNKIKKLQVWKWLTVASFYHSYTAVIKVQGYTCLCVCFHHLNDAHLDKTLYCHSWCLHYAIILFPLLLIYTFFYFFTVAVSPCSLDPNSSVTTGELDLVPALICHAKSENTVNWICSGWMKAAGWNKEHRYLARIWYEALLEDKGTNTEEETDYGSILVSLLLPVINYFCSFLFSLFQCSDLLRAVECTEWTLWPCNGLTR